MKDEGDIDFGDISSQFDEMKYFGDAKASQDEIKVELCQVKAGQMKMEKNQDVMKQQPKEIMNAQEEYQGSINRPDQMEVSRDYFCPFCASTFGHTFYRMFIYTFCVNYKVSQII
jgi:hypothetical protein